MTTVVPFPARAVRFPAGPLANAHGFPPVDEPATVDVIGHARGFAVMVGGRQFHVFNTLTNAARCAAALRGLQTLGCLDLAISQHQPTDMEDLIAGQNLERQP